MVKLPKMVVSFKESRLRYNRRKKRTRVLENIKKQLRDAEKKSNLNKSKAEWKKTDAGKAAEKRYREGEVGKEYQKNYQKEWNQTETGKESNRKSATKYCNNNPKKCKERANKYRKNNPEKCKERANKYRKNNLEKFREYMREWYKNGNGRESFAKSQAKRDRNLGYNPINNHFEGSEGHHLNEDLVMYIPKDLHKSISHSVLKDRNMQEINNASFEWLCTQEAL